MRHRARACMAKPHFKAHIDLTYYGSQGSSGDDAWSCPGQVSSNRVNKQKYMYKHCGTFRWSTHRKDKHGYIMQPPHRRDQHQVSKPPCCEAQVPSTDTLCHYVWCCLNCPYPVWSHFRALLILLCHVISVWYCKLTFYFVAWHCDLTIFVKLKKVFQALTVIDPHSTLDSQTQKSCIRKLQ